MPMGQAICLVTGEGLRPSSLMDLMRHLFSGVGLGLFIYCLHVQKMALHWIGGFQRLWGFQWVPGSSLRACG